MRAVVLRRPAVKVFKRLGQADRDRIKAALEALVDDPFEPRAGADVKRLQGAFAREDLYRLRVGRWRIFYAVQDQLVVIDIRDRGSAY